MAHTLIIGAGVGGLSAGLALSARGERVTVLERAPEVGGKMNRVPVGGRFIDGGPTVLTMRHVFEKLFREAGADLDERVRMRPARRIARHAWRDGSTLELYADRLRSRDAIRAFAGAENADGFERFCSYAERIYRNVEAPFIRAQRPTATRVLKELGLSALPRLMRIDSRRTVWQALGDYFPDPRLRQLFGRYATYSGNSPFLAPATFNLVAHVEAEGVWLFEDGVHSLAQAMADLIVERGGEVRTDTAVASLLESGGRVSGVRTEDGETVDADAVVFNGDIAALDAGHLGAAGKRAVAGHGYNEQARSLSAVVRYGVAKTSGFELAHHNVFFSDDYEGEFQRIFDERGLPDVPTVYLCAQDRDETGQLDEAACPDGRERLYLLVNAPASADRAPLRDADISALLERTVDHLGRCGLTLEAAHERGDEPRTAQDSEETAWTTSTPHDWMTRFPGSGGAIYGPAAHAWNATLQRIGSVSKVPGLFLCGGSTHPGAGVPMVALSGQMAAESVLEARTSTPRSRLAAISGGIWTR